VALYCGAPRSRLVMLAHELFDAEHSKRFLLDYAFIVASGEINNAARWIGNPLDAVIRSQIMFTGHRR
jgi:hypothetical protein